MIYGGVFADRGDLADLQEMVTRTTAALVAKLDRFDSIAVTGMSGVVVGSPVSLDLEVPLVIIRKGSDKHHIHDGFDIVNIEHIGKRYLIVDDFVDSGDTLRRVRTEASYITGAHCAGAYLYEGDCFLWPNNQFWKSFWQDGEMR